MENKSLKDNELSEDEQEELKKLVKDWGLSHTTIEQVFRKITSAKNNEKPSVQI